MTEEASKLLVFGSVNQDIVLRVSEFPEPGETVTALTVSRATGGKGANQAAAAALQGTVTRMIGAIGDDSGGAEARASLESAGVDTAQLWVCPDVGTGTAYINVRTDGENTIVVESGANAELSGQTPGDDVFAGAGWLLLSLEVPEGEALRFAARAKGRGVKVALNASPTLAEPLTEGLVDLLIVNEVEISGLAGFGWEQTADLATAVGVDSVVVTRGGAGVHLYRRGQPVLHVPAEPAKVVDTTGCGDAFAGVMVAALARGAGYQDALSQATGFAGRAAEHPGAMAAYFQISPTAGQ
ncbi:PfkB family carbohydrate kinase [Nesterenkonia natronophila]|uniref:Ribokinase n=1 Tax=Nesterenkonia natronophila TaxID=2174932 RepID=A0A3A4F873_9MICC|nr:PfkB family carbohydrate kinase [Nesterenkonia natronophila]RJN32680.1 ribokinase [Nesterenkonia natronophila]